MKSTLIRNLIIACVISLGIGQTTISGELSTDFTLGDTLSYGSPYTGITLAGEGWELSTNLLGGIVNIEEAKYSWSVTDVVTLTFGSQAEPYGIAWGLHRPSNNKFVSVPRGHNVVSGVGVSTSVVGVGINALVGNDNYWGTRISYGIGLFGIDTKFGLSVNSNDAQLIDVSVNGSALGFPFATSLEYDLSEEADGAYWLRGEVSPSFIKGAYLLVGLNSDDELLYGVGYNCSDNVKIITEFSSGVKDADGNDVESDFSIRASYSF